MGKIKNPPSVYRINWTYLIYPIQLKKTLTELYVSRHPSRVHTSSASTIPKVIWWTNKNVSSWKLYKLYAIILIHCTNMKNMDNDRPNPYWLVKNHSLDVYSWHCYINTKSYKSWLKCTHETNLKRKEVLSLFFGLKTRHYQRCVVRIFHVRSLDDWRDSRVDGKIFFRMVAISRLSAYWPLSGLL